MYMTLVAYGLIRAPTVVGASRLRVKHTQLTPVIANMIEMDAAAYKI